MTDWQNATDDKIRRAIAERLRYIIRKINIDEWAVFTPDEKHIHSSSTWTENGELPDDDGVTRAYKSASEPLDYGNYERLPDWPNDANAALTLPIDNDQFEEPAEWRITPPYGDHQEYITQIGRWISDGYGNGLRWNDQGKGQAASLSLAACVAWLTMKDNEQQAQGSI